jgi:uncharacterized DUF497 family protein
LLDIYFDIYYFSWREFFACDPVKRARLLKERGFDLLEMAEAFADRRRLDYADTRLDYGEERRVTIGVALGRAFTVVYTVRGQTTWLITAWPANRRERERYGKR